VCIDTLLSNVYRDTLLVPVIYRLWEITLIAGTTNVYRHTLLVPAHYKLFIHCTLHSTYCTLHIIYCALHIVYCTLHIIDTLFVPAIFCTCMQTSFETRSTANCRQGGTAVKNIFKNFRFTTRRTMILIGLIICYLVLIVNPMGRISGWLKKF